MEINSRSDLDFMERIQQEVAAHGRASRSDSRSDDAYYTSKPAEVWHRAEQTSAYASLDTFSTQALPGQEADR
jgi:phenylacetate-CoA ligase